MVYVAAVLPQREAPHLGASDKVDHMAAFLAISLLARLAYRTTPFWRLLAIVSAFGALIEFTQALPFVGRDAEWGDWAADTAAAVLGLAGGALIARRWSLAEARAS